MVKQHYQGESFSAIPLLVMHDHAPLPFFIVITEAMSTTKKKEEKKSTPKQQDLCCLTLLSSLPFLLVVPCPSLVGCDMWQRLLKPRLA